MFIRAFQKTAIFTYSYDYLYLSILLRKKMLTKPEACTTIFNTAALKVIAKTPFSTILMVEYRSAHTVSG